MSWHGYKAGDEVSVDKIVADCEKHIRDGKVKKDKEKKFFVDAIGACGHKILIYSPQHHGGWGSSPMNPNNWRTRKHKPID